MMRCERLELNVRDKSRGEITMSSKNWPGFLLDGLAPALRRRRK